MAMSTSDSTQRPPGPPAAQALDWRREWGQRAQALLVLSAVVALLGIASPHFLSTDNLLNVAQQSAINGILGIGLTFVIISGGIDLSVGSVLALCGLITADLLVRGAPAPVATLAGILAGVALGAVNGLTTTLGKIPPFIATLGMMLVARSAGTVYSGSTPISGLPEGFRLVAGTVAGVPVFIVAVAVLYGAAHFLLSRTKLGRYAYAIGGNEPAAWLSGVPTATYKVALYALSGGCAGIAAVLLTARLNAASPLAGEMYELYAIAAAVIGGTSLMGGEGRVMGTLIGALIMAVLRNGLNLLNVPSSWEGVVVGTVLIAAVIVDRARHRTRPAGRSSGWRRHRARLALGTLFASLVVGAIVYRSQGRAATLTVAFVPKQIGTPFWVTMRRGAEAEARRLGVHLITLAADRETDVERQHQIIENLIEQGVDALVLAPAGAKEVVPAVKKANQAGVPVLIVDSDTHRPTAEAAGATTATYIGSDNFQGGRLAGEAVARWLAGRGEAAVLEGIPGHESTDQRRKGFAAALAGHPGIRIVASQTASGERARGFTVTQNILQAHPGLRAIFGTNDEMALGALEAVAAAGRSQRVRVLGFDASPDALTNIRNGRMDGSVAQFPAEMGRLGVLHAVELIQRGIRPAPVLNTRVALIDRSNVEAFARDSAAPEPGPSPRKKQ
jgi:ribose/xylose/arabinose/galactoside ABC-type transport system permease subunit/ABC-type sugar transport system substrate-binding protein